MDQRTGTNLGLRMSRYYIGDRFLSLVSRVPQNICVILPRRPAYWYCGWDSALLVAALTGPLFYSRWFSREPLTSTFAKQIARLVLHPGLTHEPACSPLARSNCLANSRNASLVSPVAGLVRDCGLVGGSNRASRRQ